MEQKTPLTDAEWKIMTLLWEQSPRTMPQLTRALAPETGWDKHTVITLLKRMQQKGTVRMEEAAPARLYYPLAAREDVAREQTKTLLGRLFHGKVSLLLHTMVQSGELTEDDLEELSHVLRRARMQGGRRP